MNLNDPAGHVDGERQNLAAGIVSSESRMSNALALALMSVLGLGSLTWYYARAVLGQDRAKKAALAASAQRAQGDAPLPALGRIAAEAPSVEAERPLLGQPLAEIPLGAAADGVAPAKAAAIPPAKTPEQLTLERELSGTVFAASSVPTVSADRSNGAPDGAARSSAELPALLRPGVMSSVSARMLPARRLLLPKGAFIDCTLETAIDSTLPGLTTCVTATDTFGVDGTVVLLERGTKLIGETRGQVQQGAARIFVLWTEARTPAGVIVPLDSPGTDELGRSGLAGEVSRHFWQRFGAAMLVSVVEGAVQAAVQSSSSGSGTVLVNPSASENVLTEILKNTIGIAPTVRKSNGDRIQVLVARDVDFRAVYELRSAPARR